MTAEADTAPLAVIPPPPDDENLPDGLPVPDAEPLADDAEAQPLSTAEALAEAAAGRRPPPTIDTAAALAAAKAYLGIQTRVDTAAALEPQPWLVRHWLPLGRVVLLTGEGGAGKSTAARQLAYAVAAADPSGQQQAMAFDGETAHSAAAHASDSLSAWLEHDEAGETLRVQREHGGSPVLYVSYEDTAADFWRTVLAAHWHRTKVGSDPNAVLGDRLNFVNASGQPPMWAERIGGLLRHGFTGFGSNVLTVAEAARCRLLVLDTLAAVYGGDENSRHEVRSFLSALGDWADSTACTVLLIAHPSKSALAAGGGQSGSTDWRNGVRAVLEVNWRPDPALPTAAERKAAEANGKRARRLSVSKSNGGPTGLGRWLRWIETEAVSDSGGPTVTLRHFVATDEYPQPT